MAAEGNIAALLSERLKGANIGLVATFYDE